MGLAMKPHTNTYKTDGQVNAAIAYYRKLGLRVSWDEKRPLEVTIHYGDVKEREPTSLEHDMARLRDF